MNARLVKAAMVAATLFWPNGADASDIQERFADNEGVKIHYVTKGSGPLVVMLHGFPDFWLTWRPLMEVLGDSYRVAALDTRGYNLSDKPKGVENYAFPFLIGDVEAVIKAEGKASAIIIGHDWGAAIAWQVALNRPDLVTHLVVLSVPHPAGFAREMTTNKDQQANSQYARDFMKPGAETKLTAEGLAQNVPEAVRAEYLEAFKRSDFGAMLNYYRANYPKNTGDQVTQEAPPTWERIKAPVLIIHGAKDTALNAKGHDGTWEWVDADTTFMLIPTGGHFVQHDSAPLVNTTVRDWLNARVTK
jgi:pimeloyl-ACP methyl ester carboxylesterase